VKSGKADIDYMKNSPHVPLGFLLFFILLQINNPVQVTANKPGFLNRSLFLNILGVKKTHDWTVVS